MWTTTNHGILNCQFSQVSQWLAHARASCSLTFAPWMKKTFAFSARAANGDRTAAMSGCIVAGSLLDAVNYTKLA